MNVIKVGSRWGNLMGKSGNKKQKDIIPHLANKLYLHLYDKNVMAGKTELSLLVFVI